MKTSTCSEADYYSKNHGHGWKTIKALLKAVMLMDNNHDHNYRWRELACNLTQPFPTLRNKHAICASNKSLFVFGGRHRSTAHSDLWRYHLDTHEWERLLCKGEKPRLLQEHTMVAHKNKLYVFGGQFASGTESETPLWILDLETLIWRKHRSDSEVMTPVGRRGHTVVTYGNQMVVYGGYLDMRGSTSELWMFDMETEMWHLAYSVLDEGGPGSRHGHSAVVHSNSMWVVGGMRDLTDLCDLWRWDFSVRKWVRVRCKNSPPEVHAHTACVLNGDMIIVGGESQLTLQDTVWRYNFRSLTWHKVKFEESASSDPSPRSYHACVAVPRFLLSPTNDQNISHSEPSLRTELKPIAQTGRPNSSPGYVGESSPTDRGMHLFKNKVNPSLSMQTTKVNSGVTGAMENTENTVNTPENTCGNMTDSHCDDTHPNDYRTSQHRQIQTVTPSDQSDGRYTSTDITHLPSETYTNYNALQRLESITSNCSENTDGTRLIKKGRPSSKSADRLDELGTNCMYRTKSGGFANPLFFTQTSVDHLEPSPSKRSRQSYENSDNVVPLESSSTHALSVETVHAGLNQSSADSIQGHIPGVVKSGSLDSLLTGLGGVQITYIQINNNAPTEMNSPPVSETHPVTSNNTIVLEDIESRDLSELEQSHNVGSNRTSNPLDYPDSNELHSNFEFSLSSREGSQDLLIRQDSEDVIEMKNFNNAFARMESREETTSESDYYTWTSDFSTMEDRSNLSGPSYELSSMDVALVSRRQGTPPRNTTPDRFHVPSLRLTSPHQQETVADVNDQPVGMTMIICGGRDLTGITCETVPMPMWRLDRIKT